MVNNNELSQLFSQATEQANQLAVTMHKYVDLGIEHPEEPQFRSQYQNALSRLNLLTDIIAEKYPVMTGEKTIPTPSANDSEVKPVKVIPVDKDRELFNNLELFVNPASSAAIASITATAPYEKKVFGYYASRSVAFWYGGWAGALEGLKSVLASAIAQNQILTVVLYNIPKRDNSGGYSFGGTTSDDYINWVKQAKDVVGDCPCIWIVEPDALADLDSLTEHEKVTRITLISKTVTLLKQSINSWVYVDAGNYSWRSAAEMAIRLWPAGIANADGFSCNVSGFGWLKESVEWCEELVKLLDGKHYVIDTSRNGAGPWSNPNGPAWDDWCNPPGRLLGEEPTIKPLKNCDAYLWVKPAGESDGACKGGPSAGEWYPSYALELARTIMPVTS